MDELILVRKFIALNHTSAGVTISLATTVVNITEGQNATINITILLSESTERDVPIMLTIMQGSTFSGMCTHTLAQLPLLKVTVILQMKMTSWLLPYQHHFLME